MLTTDKWVIETVKGFQIPFVGHPVQGCRPNAPIYSTEQHLLIQEEVKALLGKGAVQVCNPVPQESFYSTLFLVPKKGGKIRPVINLKRLNEWVTPLHFKIEGMSTAKDQRLDGEHRPGYILHHPDASHSPTLSRFMVRNSTALPVYMPPIRPVLCSMGFHKSDETHIRLPSKYWGMYDCLHRRHNMLVMGESPEQVKGHLEALTYLLTGLGFVINIPKSITTPAQQIEYLGLLVDLTTLDLSLPGEKLHHIRSWIDQITKKSSQITARQLAQIIGKLHAASQAVLPAPLFYRSLQGDLQSSNQQQSELQFTADPIPTSPGGVSLVARQTKPLEWQSTLASNRDCDHQVRYISPGLGSSMRWYHAGQGDPEVMRSRRCT